MFESSESGSAVLHPPGQRYWGIVLGGGSGARLGAEQPKAFVPVAGRPLLHWSIATFARHPEITDLLVVVPRGWERNVREEVLGPLSSEFPEAAMKIRGVIPGGERRQDSARLALKAAADIEEERESARRERLRAVPQPFADASAIEAQALAEKPAPPPPVALIHDAARPLVPPELITRLLAVWRGEVPEGEGIAEGPPDAPPARVSRRKPAGAPKPVGAIPIVPLGDTLKMVDRIARVGETVRRDSLWLAQTPQVFDLATIRQLHEQAQEVSHAVTDDAMLYEWHGYPVKTTFGSPLNIKITFTQELSLVEGWLKLRA